MPRACVCVLPLLILLLAAPPVVLAQNQQRSAAQTGPDTAGVSARFQQGLTGFQRALDLIAKAKDSPSVVGTPEWNQLQSNIDRAVGLYEHLQDCVCPIVGAQSAVQHWLSIRGDHRYSDGQRSDALNAVSMGIAETTTCLATARQQAPGLVPIVAQTEAIQRKIEQNRQRPPDRNPIDRILFPDASADEPRKPLVGGVSTEGEPEVDLPPNGGTGEVIVPDSDGGMLRITIEAARNEIPKEQNVDWNDWYRRWIALIAEKVYKPANRAARGRGRWYVTSVNYRVLHTGGQVYFTSGGFWRSQYGKDATQYNAVMQGLNTVQAPPFPAGSKLQQLTRNFVFSYNYELNPGIKLGGPPAEPNANPAPKRTR